MSQIASFYLLNKSLLPDLINAAAAKVITKKNWLGKVTHYENPYTNFLKGHATASGDHSGSVFVNLYVYMQDKLQLDWAALSLEKESGQISQDTGGTTFLFSYEDAQQLLPALEAGKHSIKELQVFMEEEGEPEAGELLKEAISTLREQLLILQQTTMLILEIG